MPRKPKAATEAWVSQFIEIGLTQTEGTVERVSARLDEIEAGSAACGEALKQVNVVAYALGQVEALFRARKTVEPDRYWEPVHTSDLGQYADRYKALGKAEQDLADKYAGKCVLERK